MINAAAGFKSTMRFSASSTITASFIPSITAPRATETRSPDLMRHIPHVIKGIVIAKARAVESTCGSSCRPMMSSRLINPKERIASISTLACQLWIRRDRTNIRTRMNVPALNIRYECRIMIQNPAALSFTKWKFETSSGRSTLDQINW